MICPNCGTVHSLSDNFCRRCGWNLSGAQVPMVIEHKERAVTPYQAEQALALGGAATVVAGALVWLAKRWLASRTAETRASRLPQVISKPQPPAKGAPRPENDREMLVESWVWVRRITFRR